MCLRYFSYVLRLTQINTRQELPQAIAIAAKLVARFITVH